MGLRTKLLMSVLTLTSVLLILVSGIGYWNAKKQLVEDIDVKMSVVVDHQVTKIDSFLVGKTQTLEHLGFVMKNTTSGEISPSYFTLDKSDKTVSDLYMGFEADGRFYHGAASPMPPDYDPRKRGWYKDAVAKGKLVFSEPYVDATTGKFCVSPAMPIKDNGGKLIGVISMDILLETLSDIAKSVNLEGKGYAFIIDDKGTVLAHPDNKLLSKKLIEHEGFSGQSKEMLQKGSGNLIYTIEGEEKILVYQKIPSTGWVLGLTVPAKEVYAPLAGLRNIYIGINIFAAVIIAVFATLLARRISAPIVELTKNAQLMAEGDLTVKATVQGEDEIAVLGRAFNQMGDNLKQLAGEIIQVTDYLNEAARDMQGSAQEAGQVSEQIASTITDMASDATHQADLIENSASLVTDMARSVRIIADNVQGTGKTANLVQEAVQMGNQALGSQAQLMDESRKASISASQAISALAEKSQQIGQIVEVIGGIAGQTNLLALNAAIEAARAGEHGKGFAVVAEEVRKLAEQSGNSSQEIAALIREIQESTERAVKEMESAAKVGQELEQARATTRESFKKINDSVSEIVNQISEVSTEAKEVDGKTAQASNSISQVAGVSQNSAAATEEMAASTEEQTSAIQTIAHEAQRLLEQAESLKRVIHRFKV